MVREIGEHFVSHHWLFAPSRPRRGIKICHVRGETIGVADGETHAPSRFPNYPARTAAAIL